MTIPYGKHFLTEEDILRVVETLKSDRLTQGDQILKFEENFKEYVDASFAVSCTNGTSALDMAISCLKNSNKKVITTPMTFVASANSIIMNDLEVDFVDIDEHTGLMDLRALEKKLEQNPNEYQGVLPVAYTGLPVDLYCLQELANRFGLWILEDACHSPGAKYLDDKGNWISSGSCTHSDISIFSFHPVKHIATGEGGMATCRKEESYDFLRRYRDHGLLRDKFALESIGLVRPWEYDMTSLGHNYRLTDIQAALGASQLERAEENIDQRKNIAHTYLKELKGVGDLKFQEFDSEKFQHAYHLFIVRTKRRDELFSHLLKNGISPQVHYRPVHVHSYYKNLGFKEGEFPRAEEFYSQCISLPMYPTLKKEDLDFVISSIKLFFQK